MRSFPLIASSLAFTTLAFAHPVPANVEDDPNWQTCIGLSTMPDKRVTACSTAIDGKTETGSRLAGAHCDRGHGLTEQLGSSRTCSPISTAAMPTAIPISSTALPPTMAR